MMVNLLHLALAASILHLANTAALPVPTASAISTPSSAGTASDSTPDIPKHPLLHYLRSFFNPTSRSLPQQCATGVQIIGARGTHQPPGLGTMGNLSAEIMSRIPGSKSIGLTYPAGRSPNYKSSESKGSRNLQAYIEVFAKRCPETKIVLLGYSQGAQVVMDGVCGREAGSGEAGKDMAGVGQEYQDSIQSIVVWGDPSHVVPEVYNKGTATTNGIFPRNIWGCSAWMGKIRSWCDNGDMICASGKNADAHHEYQDKYQHVAANYVVDRYEAGLIPPLA